MNGSLTEAYAEESIAQTFSNTFIKGFGMEDMQKELLQPVQSLHYLKDTEHPNLQHITSMQRIDQEDYLWMDRFTIRNLELVSRNSEAKAYLA